SCIVQRDCAKSGIIRRPGGIGGLSGFSFQLKRRRGHMKKKNRKVDVSRREFLGAAAAAAAFTIVPRYVLGGPKFVPPSEKVNVAIIGAGGQGRTNARALFAEADAQVMAVCDVAEVTDLEKFYYKGKGGRKTVIE